MAELMEEEPSMEGAGPDYGGGDKTNQTLHGTFNNRVRIREADS